MSDKRFAKTWYTSPGWDTPALDIRCEELISSAGTIMGMDGSQVRLAIIAASAPAVADQLIGAGVDGILNLASYAPLASVGHTDDW